jgi:hypothetical protein
MSAIAKNLWPSDFGQEQQLAPVAILRAQATALGERTQNIVVGRVRTVATAVGFRHVFSVYCAPLGYQQDLLRVDHAIQFYPATITVEGQFDQETRQEAKDPIEFSKILEEVFASEPVKRIVRSLLAQSKQ